MNRHKKTGYISRFFYIRKTYARFMVFYELEKYISKSIAYYQYSSGFNKTVHRLSTKFQTAI